MARVLVSYRIADSSGHAGRLADALKAIFGRDVVFLSADDIAGGTLWRQKLTDQLRLSRVVLAVIGPTWATVAGQDGKPRLMADDDVVRFEIREALGSKLAVVPVLVGSATVPPLSSLPEDIHSLLARNVVTVRDDHWQSDVHMLARSMAALHPSLQMQFLSSRLMSWRVTIGAVILSSIVIAATHVLLVRTDVVEARTLELLPLLLLLLSGLILLTRVVVRRAR